MNNLHVFTNGIIRAISMKYSLTRAALILTLLLFTNACSNIYDKHVQWQSVEPEHFPIISATGFAPISSQKSANETQRMLMAIKASKIAAYVELVEQVYGQQVEGKTTMRDLLIDNQQLSTSVQGVIRGAKVIKSYPAGDIYTTELQVDFADVYKIYQVNLNRKEIKEVTYF